MHDQISDQWSHTKKITVAVSLQSAFRKATQTANSSNWRRDSAPGDKVIYFPERIFLIMFSRFLLIMFTRFLLIKLSWFLLIKFSWFLLIKFSPLNHVQSSFTASLGCNRVSNGKTHRCMAKVIYHGKSHGIWVLPYNGLSHGSMVKPMDIMKRYIHGFCHGTLLHRFCHALFKRKVTNCVFTQPGICFGIAAYWCQMLHCLQTPDFHFGMEI